MAATTGYDVHSGRPLQDGTEAIETLANEELEAELTVTLLGVERRQRRFDRLVQELLNRRDGYRSQLAE